VPEPVDESGEINYDLALMLDAEDLPEQGILQAYQQIALRLAEYGVAAGPWSRTPTAWQITTALTSMVTGMWSMGSTPGG